MYTCIENKDSNQNTFGVLISNTDFNCAKVYEIRIFLHNQFQPTGAIYCFGGKSGYVPKCW